MEIDLYELFDGIQASYYAMSLHALEVGLTPVSVVSNLLACTTFLYRSADFGPEERRAKLEALERRPSKPLLLEHASKPNFSVSMEEYLGDIVDDETFFEACSRLANDLTDVVCACCVGERTYYVALDLVEHVGWDLQLVIDTVSRPNRIDLGL